MTCPICSSETDPKYRPFCSRRCADIDLGRWMRGGYAIPSTAPEDVEDALEELKNALTETETKPH
ncbi:DNA gyrase inhibitor YacG [Marimonas arenosa]|uniref:DNA gyrase inhibitor YacG n=1 Tax=Marimonas arenosa TaxID=1795305 RepID=A0AAE3WED5_9RHOB|nr:DNA gyrase inhibitor YacG [Marimonas arenosa]MDQ2091182.1 DNA gyrase inhibitor YacG [Marimonas arenosa]